MKYWKYQIRLIKRLLTGKSTMIWIRPGGGKTRAILKWLSLCKKKGKKVKVILISTPLIIEDTWPEEIKSSREFSNLKYVHLYRSEYTKKSERDFNAALQQVRKGEFDIAFTTVDTFKKLPKWIWKKFNKLIVDESTKFKDPTSARFEYMQLILNKCPNIIQRVCMTGTPAPNGWLQLYSQFWIVGKNKVFGPDFEVNYKQAYFYTKQWEPYKWLLFPGFKKHIIKRIKPWVFQPHPKEYKELPPMIEKYAFVSLPKKILKYHNDMKRHNACVIGDKDILAANAGVATFKCAQIASGAVYRYTDPDDPTAGRETIHLHEIKTDMLEYLIESAGNANVMVIYSYKHDLERIKKRFPHCRDIKKDKGTIAKWKKGKLKLVSGHPASMGHGLNLQTGGNILIWYSLTPDLEHWEQVYKRLHRGDITEPVFQWYILARGTQDETTHVNLKIKYKEQESLKHAVFKYKQ